MKSNLKLTTLYEIKSWDDYWRLYDSLCISLKQQGEFDVEGELQDAKEYVNGLTDGWYEFLKRFKTVSKKYNNIFQLDDKEKCKFLISALESSLKS